MENFRIALLFTACLPLCVQAQTNASATESAEKPEEVIVIGNRGLLSLRIQLMDAEKAAYEVFNRFNDERRFDIHCGMHQRTGTRFENQVCEPEFKIQARRTHARNYFENTREMLNGFAGGIPPGEIPSENTPPVYVPAEAMIAFQQEAYRRKMREVAEAHPEFLEALKNYAETRQQYERATSTADK